ncbi:MAG TPA: hypothetical protein VKY92_13350 [Verrucomicrobiae bacterium]|nr:hypothetical protein [Verrucomicrobiae bacterium]
MKSKCTVLALFEDESAREAAMQFCDALVERFWTEFNLQMTWARWSELEHPRLAQQTEAQARESQIIVVASNPKGVLPERISWWLEAALSGRGEREGVLVGLPLAEAGISPEAAATQVYLRKLAHRHGLDYLTAVPQSLPHPETECPELYNARATQVTSVLDKILHRSHIPPGML